MLLALGTGCGAWWFWTVAAADVDGMPWLHGAHTSVHKVGTRDPEAVETDNYISSISRDSEASPSPSPSPGDQDQDLTQPLLGDHHSSEWTDEAAMAMLFSERVSHPLGAIRGLLSKIDVDDCNGDRDSSTLDVYVHDHLPPGFLAVLGVSGAGKSTLLQHLAGRLDQSFACMNTLP